MLSKLEQAARLAAGLAIAETRARILSSAPLRQKAAVKAVEQPKSAETEGLVVVAVEGLVQKAEEPEPQTKDLMGPD